MISGEWDLDFPRDRKWSNRPLGFISIRCILSPARFISFSLRRVDEVDIINKIIYEFWKKGLLIFDCEEKKQLSNDGSNLM